MSRSGAFARDIEKTGLIRELRSRTGYEKRTTEGKREKASVVARQRLRAKRKLPPRKLHEENAMYQPPVEAPPFFPLTKCEVNFDRQNDAITLLPSFYAFGCEYTSRGLLIGRDDAFKLIAAIEKALSVEK